MITDSKIIKYSDLEAFPSGLINVLTTGCFDLLHLGHIVHLEHCKKYGDILIVSVGNDETLRLLKGNNRPIHSQEIRARMIAALEVVDYVIISEEVGKMDHNNLVKLLLPDVYVVPSTDTMLEEKKLLIESNGGKFIMCNHEMVEHNGTILSTTKIIGESK